MLEGTPFNAGIAHPLIIAATTYEKPERGKEYQQHHKLHIMTHTHTHRSDCMELGKSVGRTCDLLMMRVCNGIMRLPDLELPECMGIEGIEYRVL